MANSNRPSSVSFDDFCTIIEGYLEQINHFSMAIIQMRGENLALDNRLLVRTEVVMDLATDALRKMVSHLHKTWSPNPAPTKQCTLSY
jgi:hypothetical protein